MESSADDVGREQVDAWLVPLDDSPSGPDLEYDIDVLTASPHVAEYFEAVAHAHGDSKTAANWVMGEVLAVLKRMGDRNFDSVSAVVREASNVE